MITNHSKLASAVLAVWSLVAATSAVAQNAYSIQSIGIHNNGTYAQWINDAGDVAGYHYPSGLQRAFVYRNGVFTDIGTLGGNYTWSTGINASGVVVGSSYLANNNNYHAFLFDGVLRDLGTVSGGYSEARAINAAGQVAGYSDGQAFLYTGGLMRRLVDLLPAGHGWSQLYEAIDINDAGQITGRGFHNTLGNRAFLFTPASGSTPATIVAFGTSSNTYPQWINASGQVAGRDFSNGDRVFLYTPGPSGGSFALMTGFGGTSSYPADLNDAGQVVGYSYLAGNNSYHPFLYSGGQSTDLDPAATYSQATAISNNGTVLGYANGPVLYRAGTVRRLADLMTGCDWSPSWAYDINNSGQIVGYGSQSGVGSRSFLMTPASSQTATTLTASDVSGNYRRPLQLQARLLAACSAVSNATVSFAVNGTARGTAQTDASGWARLTTTLNDVVVGTYVDGVAASFAGDGLLDASTDLATLSVSRATPIITWTPAAIVEGTPLGPDQLNATVDTAGTLSYSPSTGSLLGSGLRRLFVSFQPADTTNYNFTGGQALLAVRASNPVVSYTAAEITGLGGTSMDLRALNNAGQATGYWYLPGNSEAHAILFSNGVTTDLGTLGGSYSIAEDINDAGQITGYAYTTGNNQQHAFLYSGGAMQDIGVLLPNNGSSAGRAINANGDVALFGRNSNGYEHAFLYTAAGGSMTDLGTLGGNTYSYPYDINASRQVVGYSYVDGSCYHAFLATTAGMTDLGTLGGTCSQAMAINDAGDVVGWAYDAAGQQRAFLYRNGSMINLGTLGGNFSYANAINAQGVVTGYSYTANNNRVHAFRYENGVMTDVDVPNANSQGNDVNDPGDIVGYTTSTEGAQTAMLQRSGTVYDINSLINVGETAGVNDARLVNNPGQIIARGSSSTTRWYLLSPTTLAASSLSVLASAGVYKGTTTLTATLSIADPAGATVAFKLNGTVVGSAVTNASGVAILQGVSLGTLSAGTHVAAATASFAGSAGYSGSTAAGDLIIAKATPAITWPTPAAITYGASLTSAQLNASTNVGGQFTFTPAAGTQLSAGTHTLHVSFAPTDATNYNQAAADVNISVLKATPSISWSNPASIAYGTVLGAAQLNASSGVAGSFAYTPAAGTQLNAGNGQTLSVVFTPADTANYNTASRSVTISVGKATPSLTWNSPAGIVYGTPLGGAQLNATSPVAGSFAYTPAAGTQLNVGSGQTLSVVFTPTDSANYNTASRSVTINVSKATPSITWNTPADIVYGALLGGGQLNASSSLTGAFTYTPAAGTKLNAGDGQTLSVSFTPADSGNYNTATRSVTINVAKATPPITWNTPSAIVYGTLLGAGQLNASTPAGGTFIYTPAAGTLLSAGNGQSLSVNFAPTDTANYLPASATVLLSVLRAPSSVAVVGGTYLHDNLPHAAVGQVMGVGGPIGIPAITYTPGTTPPVAPGVYQALASFAGDSNHLPSSNTAAIVINAAPVIGSLTGPAAPLAINAQATISASFDDNATGDAHSCTFTWDDGKAPTTSAASAGITSCSATHAFSAAGVYTVGVTVTDDDSYAASSAFKYVVVYDPNAGFVTGGGWIASPAGAYVSDPSLSGKANFGFVSKYKKGMTVPTGTTEFEFQVGNLKFESSVYDWLVVSGARAQYKGTGTINGTGSFGFLLTAVDGELAGGGGSDRFRMKIWNIASGAVVYDNLLGAGDELTVDPQSLGGGSIVIHNK
jgi:probable HAF family extracellular repeat protein